MGCDGGLDLGWNSLNIKRGGDWGCERITLFKVVKGNIILIFFGSR